MKKILIILLILAIIIFIPFSGYNSLVNLQTNVEEQSSNIDTQLQRRSDLIPNLVNTVKGFAKHETDVFNAVTTARANMMSAGTMSEKSEANTEMTTALNRLIAVAEAYPEIKSNTAYTGLMDELAGTENRITYARNEYNQAVTSYNTKIRKFPARIWAGLFGFEKADFFQATQGSEKVPEVNFGE